MDKNIFNKELLVGILLVLLFYILIKKNNVLIISPNKDQMANVSYYADDINDIDMSFKNTNESIDSE